MSKQAAIEAIVWTEGPYCAAAFRQSLASLEPLLLAGVLSGVMLGASDAPQDVEAVSSDDLSVPMRRLQGQKFTPWLPLLAADQVRSKAFVALRAGEVFVPPQGALQLHKISRAPIVLQDDEGLALDYASKAFWAAGITMPTRLGRFVGTFVWDQQLAERACIILAGIHGADLAVLESAGISPRTAYLSANEERLHAAHHISWV